MLWLSVIPLGLVVFMVMLEHQVGDGLAFIRFQAGWFRFTVCTVHILYGDYKDTTKRVAEIYIQALSQKSDTRFVLARL